MRLCPGRDASGRVSSALKTTPEPRGRSLRPRPRTDRFIRGLSRAVLRLFYRRIEVTGLENLPAQGPVILVANHNNSLIDGALLMGFLPRLPRLVAASTVWKFKPIVPLMQMAGVIAIYRQKETTGAARLNAGTFAAATDLLAAGGMLSVFPEGKSHNDPDIKPLQSGTARLALQAVNEAPALIVLPVGLSFDAKGRFRSRALMELGTPIPVADLTRDHTRPAAVRALTAAMRSGMQDVAQDYDSRDSARLIGRAAELWEQPHPDLQTQASLALTTERRLDFTRRYDWLRNVHPNQTRDTWNALELYDTSLRAHGLRDAHIGANPTPRDWRRLWLRRVGELLLRLPVAAVGIALNAVLILIGLMIAPFAEPDKRATLQVFPALILSPVVWGLQGLAVGQLIGWQFGVITAFAAPLAVSQALEFLDLLIRLRFDARARRRLRRPGLMQHLRDLRRKAQAQLDVLAGLFADE